MLSSPLRKLKAVAERLAQEEVAPEAEAVDRECRWPEAGIRALAEADLMGLHVPRRLGGHEQGLLGLVALTEALGAACSSTAICYGMHCVGSAVIAAKATADQEERYLRPIAEGRHITTLALGETGTGAHFYFPQTELSREGDAFVIQGAKQFVTNGSHADSYVISTKASSPEAEMGEFSCLIVDDAPDLQWQAPWAGLGMRGNSSRGLTLDNVRVPTGNLLGEEGDELWYMFEIVAPYFLMAMSGTYLGTARAALDITTSHLRQRRHTFSGEALSNVAVFQHRIAEMWAALAKSRYLVYHAARLSDLRDPEALPAVLTCKADVADTVVRITNEAMTLCGGIAYRENSHLARLLRDARASHVMSPSTDMLKTWAGRALLGLPLL